MKKWDMPVVKELDVRMTLDGSWNSEYEGDIVYGGYNENNEYDPELPDPENPYVSYTNDSCKSMS